jgi:thiol:disulfide interchange protein
MIFLGLFALVGGAGVAGAVPGSIGYDPAANPEVDLQRAIDKAAKENKRILMEAGGEWCIWCHHLERFLKSDAEVSRLLNERFVVLKVNWSRENKNEKFFSRFPTVPGYPHLFVLENNGTVLHSQNTTDLEAASGKSYDRAKWVEFLNKWSLPAKKSR